MKYFYLFIYVLYVCVLYMYIIVVPICVHTVDVVACWRARQTNKSFHTCWIYVLVKNVVHASEGVIFTQRGVSGHGTAGLRHRGGHQAARRPECTHKDTEDPYGTSTTWILFVKRHVFATEFTFPDPVFFYFEKFCWVCSYIFAITMEKLIFAIWLPCIRDSN